MHEVGVILEFRGENLFLSNDYVTPFVWRGQEFASVEQAFNYAKAQFATKDSERYMRDILHTDEPNLSHKIGRRLPLDVVAWDMHKVSYMRQIIHAKFRTADPILVHKLLNTNSKMLIEGNDWGDKFWGRVQENGKWVGLNTLGVILMEERGWWNRGDEGRP